MGVVGLRHNIKVYYEMSRKEWTALLVTSVVIGVVFGLIRHQDGDVFSFSLAAQRFAFGTIAGFALLGMHVVIQKLSGIFFGIKVEYDKYNLGLLIGMLLSFLSFGYLPLFVTGYLTYTSIPNLRIGKFRATLPKRWECSLIAASGIVASLLITIPLNLLQIVTGAQIIHQLVVISILIALYAMLPIPILQTPNPYQVYMSRMESLEGNLPGFDIFASAPVWYFFFLGFVLTFSLLALLFAPSFLLILICALLGVGAMLLYVYVRETKIHY